MSINEALSKGGEGGGGYVLDPLNRVTFLLSLKFSRSSLLP